MFYYVITDFLILFLIFLFHYFVYFFFFFFSSRRRHTRCLSDWSSDVCSSDLAKRTDYSQVILHLAIIGPFCVGPQVAIQIKIEPMVAAVFQPIDNLPRRVTPRQRHAIENLAYDERPMKCENPLSAQEDFQFTSFYIDLDEINRVNSILPAVLIQADRLDSGLLHGALGRRWLQAVHAGILRRDHKKPPVAIV